MPGFKNKFSIHFYVSFFLLIALTNVDAFSSSDAGKNFKIVSAHFMPQEVLPVNRQIAAKTKTDLFGVRGSYADRYLTEGESLDHYVPLDFSSASDAGINTFNMLLGPFMLPRSAYSEVINKYWEYASVHPGIKMDIDIWWDGDLSKAKKFSEELKFIKSKYINAWRQINGHPVIFLMIRNSESQSVKNIDKGKLEALFSGIGGIKAPYIVLYNPSSFKKDSYVLSAANAFSSWPALDFMRSYNQIRNDADAARAESKPYFYPIMPGFQQARDGINPNIRERFGVAAYIYEWQQAIAGNFFGVNVITWNDLTEDTAIMPTGERGDSLLYLNRYFSDQYLGNSYEGFRGILIFHHKQLVYDTKFPFGVEQIPGFPCGAQNHCTEPDDYLDLVNISSALVKVRVSGVIDKEIEDKVPAGGELLLVGANHFDDTTKKLLYNVHVVKVPKFQPGRVQIVLNQGGESIKCKLQQPLIGAAQRGDLSTIGESCKLK